MWEPLAPAAEGGGEERKEFTKLESCLAPSFLLITSLVCIFVCVFFSKNGPMLGTLFGSIHALSLPRGLDPPLPHMSIVGTKALNKPEA